MPSDFATAHDEHERCVDAQAVEIVALKIRIQRLVEGSKVKDERIRTLEVERDAARAECRAWQALDADQKRKGPRGGGIGIREHLLSQLQSARAANPMPEVPPVCVNCGSTAWSVETPSKQRWCDDCGQEFDCKEGT